MYSCKNIYGIQSSVVVKSIRLLLRGGTQAQITTQLLSSWYHLEPITVSQLNLLCRGTMRIIWGQNWAVRTKSAALSSS